ncbi:LysE/ArgO family amino acid transporter [Marinobacter nanhaiticus D15-8W]|uniref:Amino acid transporter n=1 Tax=Marinobacter nanhaiticus D15-8W TaxID=626887 RepID=N6VZ55_9GAMM|nr:LysE/ArgO family amino acid transporter [Marinobacter nanhaiticus]ENO13154.1 amino acid transporter [Marinobacter nanhaiticus D15-8W]BES70514.1 LysE/ArgO family amino acid transporter [Marinobacter nanhaiticus D15-8W]
MLQSYLTGLVVCGGIIIAIGAQNAYLLGQAFRREHHWWSAALCMSADIVLFTLGMLGVSAALIAFPSALDMLRWAGVVFLLWLSFTAFVRAVQGRDGLVADEQSRRSLGAVLMTTLAVTLLNPQVYLDTLLLIPSVGAQQPDPMVFAAGASSASVMWFTLLAWGGSALAPVLSRPMAWRIIDGLISLMMLAIAVHLVVNGIHVPNPAQTGG